MKKNKQLTNKERDLFEDFTAGSVFTAQLPGDNITQTVEEICRKENILLYKNYLQKDMSLNASLALAIRVVERAQAEPGLKVLLFFKNSEVLNQKDTDALNEVLSNRTFLGYALPRNVYMLATGTYRLATRMCFNNQNYDNSKG